MPDRVRRLLDHLVVDYVVREEQREIDLSAPAAELGAEIASEKQRAAAREARRADDLANAFERGLVGAYRAQRAGQPELVLDDRQPDENQMADALIRFLVTLELASSRTEETEPLHYVYYVAVDWIKLAAVAAEAEIDLDATLSEATARSGG